MYIQPAATRTWSQKSVSFSYLKTILSAGRGGHQKLYITIYNYTFLEAFISLSCYPNSPPSPSSQEKEANTTTSGLQPSNVTLKPYLYRAMSKLTMLTLMSNCGENYYVLYFILDDLFLQKNLENLLTSFTITKNGFMTFILTK
jgi:hypothetical protein